MGNIEKYMDLALKLSLRAKGLTSPNPLVGAVIVKNDKIISTGFHKRSGLDHAEITALKNAGLKAKGATLYVALEPCSTFGKTPPCTDAIIRSGIKKVVIGMVDPNPRHQGMGVKILRRHNIKVINGILEHCIRAINQPFIKYITKNIPYITVKIAQSLDGKIATRTGDSKWITSQASRGFSHKIRNNYDAIMVGINTVLKDNPQLNPDRKIKGKKFYKIILDTHLRIKNNVRILKDILDYQVIIATARESIIKKSTKVDSLAKKGAIILGINTKNNFLDLNDILKKLGLLEVTNILVEGGGGVIGSLFDNDLVDYLYCFISPKIMGGEKAISSVQGLGINKIRYIKEIMDVKLKKLNKDFLFEGAIHKY